MRAVRLLWIALFGVVTAFAADREELVRQALAAEGRFDARAALQLLLQAEKVGPPDAFLLQRIARQYSDLALDTTQREEQRALATSALDYSKRALAIEPTNAVAALSVAISYGKLALFSDTAEKVRHSRSVREYAERALAADPNYAWAHHILGRWHREVAELGAASRTVVRLFFGGLPPATKAAALEHLQRAVALEPKELQHHLELGLTLLAVGDTPGGRAAVERGLAMPDRAKIDAPAKTAARTILSSLSQ